MSVIDGDKCIHVYGKYVCFIQGNIMWTENISAKLFFRVLWLKIKLLFK